MKRGGRVERGERPAAIDDGGGWSAAADEDARSPGVEAGAECDHATVVDGRDAKVMGVEGSAVVDDVDELVTRRGDRQGLCHAKGDSCRQKSGTKPASNKAPSRLRYGKSH